MTNNIRKDWGYIVNSPDILAIMPHTEVQGIFPTLKLA